MQFAVHRYLLAESKDALYVAFVGTKQRRDIMTNANIMHEAMWPKRTHANGAHTAPQVTLFCTDRQSFHNISNQQDCTDVQRNVPSSNKLIFKLHQLFEV